MKTTIKAVAIFAAIFTSTASAYADEIEVPVETPVVEDTKARHDRSDMAGAVAVMAALALAALVYNQRKAETSNCDGVSDQTIYGADGKAIVAGTTGLCD